MRKNTPVPFRLMPLLLAAVFILFLLIHPAALTAYAEDGNAERTAAEQGPEREPETENDPSESGETGETYEGGEQDTEKTEDEREKSVNEEDGPAENDTEEQTEDPAPSRETEDFEQKEENGDEDDENRPFLDEDYAEYRLWDRYSQNYTVKTGEAIKQKFLRSAISFIGTGSDELYTSAMYVTVCADMAGMVEAGTVPLTPNADELYSSVESGSFSEVYDLGRYLRESALAADSLSGSISGRESCTGSLIFLTEGSDSDYREWMKVKHAEYAEECPEEDEELRPYPFYDLIQYREVRIVVGEGPGYFITAGMSGDMVPGIEIITADSAPDGARLVRISFQGEAEKIADCIARYSGFNAAAVAGILSNIYYESSFKADKVGDGGFSLGLCQWQGQRKQNLIEYCERNGAEPTDMEAQIAFMVDELRTQYPQTWAYLSNIRNDSEGAYYAASRFCLWYEIPADCYEKAAYRGGAAEFLFYGIAATVTE